MDREGEIKDVNSLNENGTWGNNLGELAMQI